MSDARGSAFCGQCDARTTTAQESVAIVLPLPDACLSPNRPPGSIGGRMKRASSSRRMRRLARDAILAEAVESGPWQRAAVQAKFFHKQRRRRDDVNHLAMLKPYYDGAVDSGLLVDDDSEHLSTLTPEFCIDAGLSRVELTFTRC